MPALPVDYIQHEASRSPLGCNVEFYRRLLVRYQTIPILVEIHCGVTLRDAEASLRYDLIQSMLSV